MNHDQPRSESIKRYRIGPWYITHAVWHTFVLAANSTMPTYETGVRDLDADGQEIEGSFRLIQHDWHNWDAIDALLPRMLAKGWDETKCADVLGRIQQIRQKKPELI